MTTTTSSAEPSRSVERARIWRFGLIWGRFGDGHQPAALRSDPDCRCVLSVRRTEGADPTEITALYITIMTHAPFLLGPAAGDVDTRRTSHGLRIVAIVGAGIALVSLAVPLSVEADTAAKVVLAAMHLVAGGAFVAALAYVRIA